MLGKPALKEMVDHYEGGNMVAVMDVPQEDTKAYGIVTAGHDDGTKVTINGLVEKPEPEKALEHRGHRALYHRAVFDALGK